MNIGRLNINVGGIASGGYQGSNVDFNEIASQVGCSLPQSYVQLLQFADGGHPEVGSFYPLGGDKNNLFDVDWFYSIANQAVENLQTAIQQWGDTLGKCMLPIGRDGGGNQIYLDLNDTPPSVFIYLHDEQKKRMKLANSFEEFIDGLQPNPDLV